MKLIWKTMLLLMFASSSLAQVNLVDNGSFEDTVECPTSSGWVSDCVSWHGILNTPDYFNVCASFPVSIPSNFTGTQMPFEGNAYMGLVTYYFWVPTARELIGTKLNDTLIPGMSYHISMRVSRGNATFNNYCGTATDKMGIRFTTFEHTLSNPPAINNFAQLHEDTLVTDTLNWVLLAWDYIPDSAYTHIYIGNFFDDANTDTMGIGTLYGQAYYYIDSLNIICMNCTSGISEVAQGNQAISYNSLTGIVSIDYTKNATVSVYNNEGKLILREGIDGYLTLNLKQYGSGVFIVVLDDGKSLASKKIISIF